MVWEGGDGAGDWAELGPERPEPEQGYTAHPLYDRATLEAAVAAERERTAREGLAMVRGRVFDDLTEG